jgi:phage shock protein PspC (stress-responsive transcriptional regulator)
MTASPNTQPATGFTEPEAIPGQRRLFRSRTNRVFAGVCGGIAAYFGADATAVRLLTAILGLITGIFPMLILYLFAAILVPEGEGGVAAAGSGPAVTVTPGQGGLIVGVVLIVGGVAALANEWLRIDWQLIWPAVLIIVGGFVVFAAMSRSNR